MDDQKQQEARWRESLELLGLSDDAPAAAPKPPARESEPPPPPVVEPRRAELVHDSVADDRYSEVDEAVLPEAMPDAVDDTASDTEVEFVEENDFAEAPPRLERGSAPQAAEKTADEAGPSAEGDDGKPKRGRRRRRRGRRRGGADGEGAAKSDNPEAAPVDAKASPPREQHGNRNRDRDRRGAGSREGRGDRDRRGPAKQRPAPRAEPAKVQADERWEEETPSAEVDDLEIPLPTPPGENEEVDTLADWDVPSWQDLISGLYRPER